MIYHNTHTCYIGLGSNINPEANLKGAAVELRTMFTSGVFSGVYRTAPLYEENQSAFLNAVARITTADAPDVVFGKLQTIERALGKNPPYPRGPRTIDLDLLLYNGQQIDDRRIRVPHPRMHERRFVLEPLCELVERRERHPVLGERWGDLLETVKDQECDRTGIVLPG